MRAHSKFGGGIRLNAYLEPKRVLLATWYVHGVPGAGHRFVFDQKTFTVDSVTWVSAGEINVYVIPASR